MQKSVDENTDIFSVESLRAALRLCYRPKHLSRLGRHPLAKRMMVENMRLEKKRDDNDIDRGRSLRDVLFDAIKEHKPDEPTPNYEDEKWVYYLSIKEQYFDGTPRSEMIEKTNYSQSSYYRKQGEAIRDLLIHTLKKYDAEATNHQTLSHYPKLHMVPAKPPYKLVGRDVLVKKLIMRILNDEGNHILALVGSPGVGKTALAVQLAHNPEVGIQFPDGVFWGKLGKDPDILGRLGEWALELGVSPQELEALDTNERIAIRIRSAIGERRMLFVIDDAWDYESASAFKNCGDNCAYILTTRNFNVAQQFAGDLGIARITELDKDDGITLVHNLAPKITVNWQDEINWLVKIYGGNPLGLTIMGTYLGVESHDGQTDRIRGAFEKLKDRTERLKLTEKRSIVNGHPNPEDYSERSLETLISLSDEELPEIGRIALRALSVFPPKPNTFSAHAALAVIGQPIEVLDMLSDYSLLESNEDGRYTLHQTIYDYARENITEKEPFAQMVYYFVNFLRDNAREYDLVRLETDNISAGLEYALAERMYEAFIKMVNDYYFFLESRGRYSESIDLLNKAQELADKTDDYLGLASTLINQGRLGRLRGNNSEAEEFYSKALSIAKELSNPDIRSSAFDGLGVVTAINGDLDVAKEYLVLSLNDAREVRSEAKLCDILIDSATVDIYRSKFDDAEDELIEALLLAYENKYRSRIVKILINFASIADRRGDDELSEAYLLESLDVARNLGYALDQILILSNLGAVAIEKEKYYRSLEHLHKALPLAREINDKQRLSETLRNLGEASAKIGDKFKSEKYLEESLTLARELGNRQLINGILCIRGEVKLQNNELDIANDSFMEVLEYPKAANEDVAIAKFGLARMHKALGNYQKARRLGEESLSIFILLNHRRIDEVKKWLSSLPNGH